MACGWPRRLPRKRLAGPTSAEDLGLTLSVNDGQLLVVGVRENSAMARAGFKVGDQIEIVNGKAVHSIEEFQQALGVVTVGQEVPIVIVRNEHSETLKWTPQANDLTLPDNEAAAAEIPPGEEANEINFIAAAQLTRGQRGQPFLGVRVDPNEAKQVIVQTVMSGSPAEKAGLQPGDRIYSLSGVNLRSPQELGQMIARDAPGAAVYLYIGRGLHSSGKACGSARRTPRACRTMPAGTMGPSLPKPPARLSPNRLTALNAGSLTPRRSSRRCRIRTLGEELPLPTSAAASAIGRIRP